MPISTLHGWITLTLLAVAPLACLGSPRRVQGPTRTYLDEERPGRVWVTMSNGSGRELREPRVIGDTLVALSAGRVIAVPMDSVAEIRARRLSLMRNLIMFGMLGAAGAFFSIRIDPAAPVPIDSSDFYDCRTMPAACN